MQHILVLDQKQNCWRSPIVRGHFCYLSRVRDSFGEDSNRMRFFCPAQMLYAQMLNTVRIDFYPPKIERNYFTPNSRAAPHTTNNTHLHEFQVHKPSNKGTKLLFHVIGTTKKQPQKNTEAQQTQGLQIHQHTDQIYHRSAHKTNAAPVIASPGPCTSIHTLLPVCVLHDFLLLISFGGRSVKNGLN